MDIPAAVRGSSVPLRVHADAPVRQRSTRPSPQKAARTITLRSCGEAQALPVEQIVYAEVFDHELPYVAGLRRYRITLAGGAALPVSKQNYLLIQRALAAYRLRAGRPHP